MSNALKIKNILKIIRVITITSVLLSGCSSLESSNTNATDEITGQSSIKNDELKWKWIVEAGKYEDLSFVDENWIAVKGGNGKYKVINTKGDVVLPDEYDEIYRFYDGVATVSIDGKFSYIDKKGRSITEEWCQDVGLFSESRGAVQQNNKWGYINQSGELVIQPQFEEVKSFIGIRAAVKLANKWGFIDKSGHMVVKSQYDQVEDYSEGMAAVQLDEKWGFVNSDGNLITELEYDKVNDFHEGYAAVMQNNKWGFIDTHGQVSIDLKYDDVGNFSEGKAAVKVSEYTEDGDAWAYIDYDGNIVIDFFPYSAVEGLMIKVGEFKNGLAFVSKDFYSIIDSEGNDVLYGSDSKFFISPAFYYDKQFNVIPGYTFTDESMKVRKYGLLGLHGEQRLEPSFDFLGVMNGPYATVINIENGIDKMGIIEIYKCSNTQKEKEEIYFERFAVKNIERHTDILIEYPQIKNMKSLELEMKINKLLKEKAISYYEDEDVDGLDLPMETKVEYFNSNIISVKYTGYGYYSGTIHGNDITYATNINLKTGEIIDIRNLFTDRFREKLNRNVFKYIGPEQVSEGESIDPNSHEYRYINADDSIISKMFENYNSNKYVDNYYFSEKSFNIIMETPSGPTVFLELAASYDDLKDCMNNDDGFWDEILELK